MDSLLQKTKAKGNCHSQCVDIVSKITSDSSNANIREVSNKHNPFGNNLGYDVEHIKGNYERHFVVQIGNSILDPFLREMGLIPLDKYLTKVYKNHEELQIV
jgi:hypothetical protein